MPPQLLIFANPIAGRGGARNLARKLSDRLCQEGWEVHLLDPRQPSLADAGHAQAAIVIGGDGSLRAVAQFLLRDEATAGIPLLPVPMGTANLMGRHFNIHWTPRTLFAQVISALRHPAVRHLDAGAANGEPFLVMAGVGMDGQIVHELDKLRTGPITLASYAIPAAVALGFYDYAPLTVQADGRTLIEDQPAMALVCNVSEHGLGFPFLPMARPDDGLLDLCILPCSNRAEAISLFLHAAAGEHLNAEGVQTATGKHFSVRSRRPVPVQTDGEAAGHTPVEITLLPRRVPFIVMEQK